MGDCSGFFDSIWLCVQKKNKVSVAKFSNSIMRLQILGNSGKRWKNSFLLGTYLISNKARNRFCIVGILNSGISICEKRDKNPPTN